MTASPNTLPDMLGERLLADGLVNADQLRIARLEQEQRPRPLAALLVELGFVREHALRDTLASMHGRRCADLGGHTADPAALALVPRDFARRHRVLPLALDRAARRLTIATAEADDRLLLERLRVLIEADLDIDSLLAGEAELARAIERHYGHTGSVEDILRELESGAAARSGATAEQPVVRLVDAVLADAIRRAASDLHFEPEAGHLGIRYRIDGQLRQIHALHRTLWPAMAVRLKVLAGLDIAESRTPQDGHFTLQMHGHTVDFRVSCLPTLHGENIVLRILDRNKGVVALDALGLDPGQLDRLRRMSLRPEGLILVTGPTGSGKTTTLYALLDHLDGERLNIMTLEDPVEYPMARLRQTAVAEARRLDFAGGVRAILRQDPDVILIGEIRDAETAAMALRAALTGHQVYATLHANSAAAALPRLQELGVGGDLLAGNLIGVVAQRLLRRLCPHCRRPASGNGPPYRPGGCIRCDFQGYRGRFAIMEILTMDAELDDLVARRAGSRDILAHARAHGFRPLTEDGLRHVRAGHTSAEELARVTGYDAYAR